MTLNTIIKQTITNYLNDNPHATTNDIVEYTGCHLVLIIDILQILEDDNVIERQVGYVVN